MADEQETKYCSNCKRQIAAANFIMHEAHCRRNIALCERCQEPVPYSETEAHFEEYHAKTPCPLCQQKFERSLLEDHQLLCPKRTVHCDYCQLDMAACDLTEHKDYCGTRTERCPNCSQFIMLKDMDQHEVSLCTYPPPKQPAESSANNEASRRNSNPPAEDFDAHLINPFAMNELSRILNEPSSTPSVRNNIAVARGGGGAGVSSQQATGQTSLTGSRLARSQIRPRPRLEINRNISRSKNTNESAQLRNRNTNTNIRPKNQQPSHGLGSSRQPAENLDEILARHLAQDLNQDIFSDGIDNLVDLGESDSNQTRRRSPIHQPEDDSEDICLPCEFCGEPFPVEIFVEHQSSCNPDVPSSYANVSDPVDISPRLSPSDTYEDVLPNNSPRRSTTSSSQPSQPHIVDNLSMLAAQDWFTSPAAAASGLEGEGTMLPCEFCDQLYPDDLLVQHQAVCEVDSSTPPMSRSPNARSSSQRSIPNLEFRSLRSRSNVIGAAGAEGTRARVGRRQGDPTFDFRSNDIDSVSTSPTNISRGRYGITGRRTIPKDSNRNTPAGLRTRGQGTTSVSSTASRYSRKSNNSVSRTPIEADRETSPENRRRGSASRANRTLEQLLSDPTSSTTELLAALDKDEKSNRNQQTKEAAGGAESDNREYGDVSLSDAISGSKPRRRQARPFEERAGGSGYDPSFSVSSRPAPRISSKPRPVVPRAADFSGASNLRVNKPRITTTSNGRGAEPSVRPAANGNVTRKRTSSRPRKAPQGEP